MLNFGLRFWLILLSSYGFSVVVAAQQYWMTTHSPLTAFKQLGFEEGNYPAQQSHSVIPYSISDYSSSNSDSASVSQQTLSNNKQSSSSSSGVTKIRHPNDILSNMGVDLPSKEILGKISSFNTYVYVLRYIVRFFASIYLRNCLKTEAE